jgi:hypothetical protein
MARRIKIDVAGVSALAELHDDVSPLTAEAFWQTLPISTTVVSSIWSGQAATFAPGGTALSGVTQAENPVCTIYPGTIAVAPGGTEALIGYGPNEYRNELGTIYASRVAKIVEGRDALLKKLAATHDEGELAIRISRA